jgi:hypothetical protein
MGGTGARNSGEQAAGAGGVVFSPVRYDNTAFLVVCAVHGCSCGRWQEGQVHTVTENQDEGAPFTRDEVDCDAGVVHTDLAMCACFYGTIPSAFFIQFK